MKKIILIIICICLLSLSACSKQTNEIVVKEEQEIIEEYNYEEINELPQFLKGRNLSDEELFSNFKHQTI